MKSDPSPFVGMSVDDARKAEMMDKARAAVVDMIAREAPLTTADLFYLSLGFSAALGECYGDCLHPTNSLAAMRAEASFLRETANYVAGAGARHLEQNGMARHDA